MRRQLFIVLALIVSSVALAQTNQYGAFSGPIDVRLDRDGRWATVLAPFSFRDPKGKLWDVPKGARSDGASVPQVFWIVFPPFTGKYRDAAVVHDHYCVTQERSWQETHEVFYYAMRAAGVGEASAKLMYGAVWQFGPRWGLGAGSRGPDADLPQDEQVRRLKELEAWIAAQNPDLSAIARKR